MGARRAAIRRRRKSRLLDPNVSLRLVILRALCLEVLRNAINYRILTPTAYCNTIATSCSTCVGDKLIYSSRGICKKLQITQFEESSPRLF